MRGLRTAILALGALVAMALVGGAAPSLGDDPGETDERLQIHGLHVDSAEGRWQSVRRFHVAWDPPSAETRPLIRGLGYRIDDAQGNVVVPPVHIDEDFSPSFVAIAVPPVPGVYTAWVWLEGEVAPGPPEPATLRFDDVAPASVQPLPSPGWIKAGTDASVGIEHPAAPWPLAGIRGYAVALDHGAGRPCELPDRCSAAETDLDGGAEDDGVSLGPLAEGVHLIRVLAVSGSGMSSTAVGTAALKVDGTAPNVAFEPTAEGWSDGPVRVGALATDELSGMDPGGSGAITALAVDGGPKQVSPGGAAAVTVHGEGIHLVTASARDAAGNATWEHDAGAPAAAVVRIDEAPPRVAFAAAQDPAEPERLEALVTDSLSGPAARGWIEVRPAGGKRPYAPLPTRASAGRLVAIWSSDDFAPGDYDFRAVAFDAAGNRASTGSREGGAPMRLPSPLKARTQVHLGFGGRRSSAQRCRRDRGRIRCRRQPTAPLDRRPALARFRYGRSMPLTGRVSTPAAAPPAGLSVAVTEEFEPGTGLEPRTTTVQTAADGGFSARLEPGPNRRVRVEFGGNRLLSRSCSRQLRLEVRPAVRLYASVRTARVGGPPVVFSGSVSPVPISPVELQFRVAHGRWSEFRGVEADATGHFRYPYAFSDNDSRGVSFQFRAVVPRRPGWPYAPGASLPVMVTGR